MKSPYAKAIVAAICAGVITAATVFDNPYLVVAGAIAAPISVFLYPNEVR